MNTNKEIQGIKKNIAKLIVAVALTLAVAFGGGIVEQELGLDITPTAYAGGSCASGGGGGC